MLDFKKLFKKAVMTRALAALLLALILCISACDGQGTGNGTTAPDLGDPTTQQTTPVESESDEPTEQPTEDATEQPTEDPTTDDSQSTEQPTDPDTTPEDPTTDPDTTPEDPTTESDTSIEDNTTRPGENAPDFSELPAYSGQYSIPLNNNIPWFTAAEKVTASYETYGELDALGRCTVVMACCGRDLMPTDDRGSISSIKPTGWVQNTYSCVNGGSLYNRCHLIGWQITGEDANARNLITGTRYFNENMIPYENMIADYIKETGNHVMYRVTPVFEGNNLVATGAVMEAWSVEDEGEGVCFNVYLYNVQPGIYIDYATGNNYLEADGGTTTPEQTTDYPDDGLLHLILNTSSKRVHKPSCSGVAQMAEKNKKEFAGTQEELDALLAQGYKLCGTCH